jgi:phage replication O-like protein O
MANPQKENGFTPISNEILDNLVKLRIPPSEKDLCMFVLRKTYGFHKKTDRISLTQFELATLLSRPTVVKSLKNLITRNILVKAGLLFSFNKNYDSWVVNAGLLVKSCNLYGKRGLTKNGKRGLTYKRKKIMTKEIPELRSENVVSIIKSFENINPATKRMYGNTNQRKACLDLIEDYGFEKVIKVINEVLPKSNELEYFPTITTPTQLRDKWVALESAIKKYQSKKLSTKNKYQVI